MPVRELKIESPELRLDPAEVREGAVDWRRVFSADRPVEIEVGIGKGRFLLAAAAARPDVSHLGIEWANKYLRFAEARARKRGLANVRFLRADARALVHQSVPAASVRAYYVLYPDPWPKKRHQKRRFVRADTAWHLARTLERGGTLHVATDHEAYWKTIESTLDGHPCFERLERFGGEVFPLPVDGPLTNFETKYREQGRNRFRASWRRNAAALPEPPPEAVSNRRSG